VQGKKKRFIDATYTFDGKTVRSLDAKHPVEMNTVNDTCYVTFKVIQNENFPLSRPQRHVGGAKVQHHSISNSGQLNRRLSGHRNPLSTIWKREISLALAAIRTQDRSARSLVSIPSYSNSNGNVIVIIKVVCKSGSAGKNASYVPT